MKRKSPIKHKVCNHIRKHRPVKSYVRGKGFTIHPMLIRYKSLLKPMKVTPTELELFNKELKDQFNKAKYIYRFSTGIAEVNSWLEENKMGHPTRYQDTSFTLDPNLKMGWIRFKLDKDEMLKHNKMKVVEYGEDIKYYGFDPTKHISRLAIEQEVITIGRANVPITAVKEIAIYYRQLKNSKEKYESQYRRWITSTATRIVKKVKPYKIPVVYKVLTPVEEKESIKKWRKKFDLLASPTKERRKILT